MHTDLAFAPYGEQYAVSGNVGVQGASFAGNPEDTTTNLYDAQFREYGIQGRWPSPDPAGAASANPANPQSWNRYAYALNNPLMLVDPSGLQGRDFMLEPPPPPIFDEFSMLHLIMQSAGLTQTGVSVIEENGSLYYTWGGVSPINFVGFDSNGLPIYSMSDLSAASLLLVGEDWTDIFDFMQSNSNSGVALGLAFPPGMSGAWQAMKAAAKGIPKVEGPGSLTPTEQVTADELMQKVLDDTANTPLAKALKAVQGLITTFGGTLSDFMISVSPCATPQLRAQFPGLCGGPMD